jgi:hypothetical protein
LWVGPKLFLQNWLVKWGLPSLIYTYAVNSSAVTADQNLELCSTIILLAHK